MFFGILLSLPGVCEPAVALYYGKSLTLSAFKSYDIVVVDPDHAHDPQRHARSSSQLYAYAALAEAHPGRAYFRQIPETWKIARNADWGSVVIDQTPAEWPDFFASRVIAPLWAKGYRGFFLDTLDSYRLAAKFDEKAQQAGQIRVIETLHKRFPGIKLILNRGFEIVPSVRDKIQMVAAESLFKGWNAGIGQYVDVPAADREWLLGQLNTIRKRDGLPILAIDYLPPDDRATMRATADKIRQLGFTPWISDQALSTVGIGSIEPIPRRILIMHDGRDAASVKLGNAHRYLEMPINHMGYVADYASALSALPGDIHADRYAGIVTWFSGNIEERQARKLGRWLQDKREHGMPIAVFGEFGYPLDHGLARELDLATSSAPSGRIRIDTADAMIGFEASPRPARTRLTPIRTTNPADRPLLGLRDDRNNAFTGAAITRWGGFVLNPFVLDDIPGSAQLRWVIDPFAFLTAALRLPPIPVPDFTTENGRRLLFSHIDGDGFPSPAEMPGHALAAEVLYREILQKYRVPTTASVIASEIAPDGRYPKLSPRLEAIARQIFALPHVEIASQPGRPGQTLDRQQEIGGAVDYIRQRLAPSGKPVGIMQWPDDAPDPDAIGIAQAAGLLNMNGGGAYISRHHPSLTAVSPPGIRIGESRQIYSPIASESAYTHFWRGPFYGYAEVIDTFEMTESPRRLKPVGIHYHAYSASKPASLQALHRVFAWTAGQPLHPVFASEYVRKALDFDSMAIAREGDGWRIRGDGHLRTLRLPAGRRPDLDTAVGVAGFSSGREGSYLHLADDAAWFSATESTTRQPYLVDANGRLHDWTRRQDETGRHIHFRLSAHAPLDFRLANIEGCQTRINGKPANAGRTEIVDGQSATRFRRPDAAATLDIRCPGR